MYGAAWKSRQQKTRSFALKSLTHKQCNNMKWKHEQFIDKTSSRIEPTLQNISKFVYSVQRQYHSKLRLNGQKPYHLTNTVSVQRTNLTKLILIRNRMLSELCTKCGWLQ